MYKPLYIAAPMIAVIFALTSIAVIPFGNWVTLFGVYDSAADHGREYRTADRAGHHFARRVRSCAGGVVVEQQVFAAGRVAGERADGELRDCAGAVAGRRADHGGSFSLRDIVDAQAGTYFWGFIPRWNIFQGQFVAFFIYLMAAYAETNRIPFDLPEAETELVAGYHTEYSAMKFAMFFMAEYANMITVACLASLLFLGGWRGPLFGPPLLQALLPLFWFALRIFGISVPLYMDARHVAALPL